MHSESFLEHQCQIHSRFGEDNAQALFGITGIPSDPQLRNVLDKVTETSLINIYLGLSNAPPERLSLVLRSPGS
jgi:hypothetical protein